MIDFFLINDGFFPMSLVYLWPSMIIKNQPIIILGKTN